MISVLIVDDHDIVRAGISRLLSDCDGIKVIGAASSGEEAIKIAKIKFPQVILMDVRMPGLDGLETTKKLLRIDSSFKIIALTVCNDDHFPTKLLQAGAFGYLTKGAGLEEMVKAIRAVYRGNRYIEPQIAQKIAIKNTSKNCNIDNPLELLSERELQITLMITSGRKVNDIAKHLRLSAKTVNSYRYRIFDKLSIRSDVELTHVAIRAGLLDLLEKN